jgi:hypothetical protein
MACVTSTGCLPSQASGREWLAVASVALGTFALVTSEFLLVGLLTKVAADLHASEGATGLMRRLKNVKTEIGLHVLAYNMKRVMQILGPGPLMAAMRT